MYFFSGWSLCILSICGLTHSNIVTKPHPVGSSRGTAIFASTVCTATWASSAIVASGGYLGPWFVRWLNQRLASGYVKIAKMAQSKIVDLPMKNGGFPVRYVSLPEITLMNIWWILITYWCLATENPYCCSALMGIPGWDEGRMLFLCQFGPLPALCYQRKTEKEGTT